MPSIIAQAFYFMLPAYFANMAPVIVKNIFKGLAVPLDLGKKFHGEEIFGSHKTFRGLIAGVAFAMAVAYAQSLLASFPSFGDVGIVDYSRWILIGFLLGFGAIGGDLVKSFLKRRAGVPPGTRFIPWDQLDFVIGSLLLGSIIADYSTAFALTAIAVSILGHVLVNHFAYYTKIRGEKW